MYVIKNKLKNINIQTIEKQEFYDKIVAVHIPKDVRINDVILRFKCDMFLSFVAYAENVYVCYTTDFLLYFSLQTSKKNTCRKTQKNKRRCIVSAWKNETRRLVSRVF